jgi:hypothetical protein
VGVEAADHVPAAVIIDDRRHRRRGLRPVEAQADVAGGARHQALFDSGDRQRLGLARPRRRFHLLARLGRRHLFDRPKLRLGHRPQNFLDLWMKARHYALRPVVAAR